MRLLEKQSDQMSDKLCTNCDETKDKSEFYKLPKNRDGLRGQCKSCVIDQSLKWQKKHPERTLETRRLNKTGVFRRPKKESPFILLKLWDN